MYLLALLIVTNIYSQECQQYQADLSAIKSCEGKSVHLTFDDGPNTTTTPKIVETLKRQNVKATFFVSTHQLEKGDLDHKKKILKSILDSGHTVSSHGHDHNCHDIRYVQNTLQPGYSDDERRNQIKKSVSLLEKFTDGGFKKQKHTLLRFPYGRGISPSQREINEMINQGRLIEGSNYKERLEYYRAHSPAMSVASEYNLSHVGWNHDSHDASSKYDLPGKKLDTKKYIKDQLNYLCSGNTKNYMSLFHDTRVINSAPSNFNKNKTVMDELIEKGKCLGIKFVSMEQYLAGDIQDGVYTNAYNSTEKVKELISSANELTPISPGDVCSVHDNSHTLKQLSGNSCYSEYIGEVKHCHGDQSICLDGQWIKNKKLASLVCEDNLSVDAGKDLSSKYINKKCEVPGQRISREKIVACYCQISNTEELRWNCSDISSGIAKPI
jgi:peptidoglycan/xylan/chitin deacetylase (PgdA/CDA1 family)